MKIEMLKRNLERIERIESIMTEMRNDSEYQAFIVSSTWYDHNGYKKAEADASSYVFDLASALEDSIEAR